MTTLLEDLGNALKQACRSIGLSNTASTVVVLVVLGVVLNAAALSVVESMRNGKHPGHHQVRTALRTAARSEVKAVKAVWISSLKKMGRNWCPTGRKTVDHKTESTEYDFKVGVTWGGPGNRKCDVSLDDGSPRRIAFVAC
ncbi:MAG TPA: hypothetical protein VNU92_12715 [Edaphobacter sp.]|jgi:hypothetical protein|nr:hypothetical protein [Edaphobacter sp.]